MATYLGGKVDVSINGVTIPAHYIGEDGVVTTLTEATRDISTMAGTFTQASGTYEEATMVFSVVLPNMNYLKNIFPDLYTASIDRPTVAGQTVFGGDTCSARSNTPVVSHYTCLENSDDDVLIPNGSVMASVELTQNASDPVTVEVTVNAQPNEDEDLAPLGAIAVLGTGSLTGETIWDAAAGAYVPVGS